MNILNHMTTVRSRSCEFVEQMAPYRRSLRALCSHGTYKTASMPDNRMCSLSIVHGSYDGVNLKYHLWPGMIWNRILWEKWNLLWNWYNKDQFCFDCSQVNSWGSNVEHKLRILFLYKYLSFHLELLTGNCNTVDDRNCTVSHPQYRYWCQMVLGWYVQKTKPVVSCAEFYKRYALSIEVIGLMFLS